MTTKAETSIKNQSQPIPLISTKTQIHKEAWNKGKLLGQKPPLKLKEVWEIRIRLQIADNCRELALFTFWVIS